MNKSYPTITLKQEREQSWLFGHPWIFSKALKESYPIPHGSLVTVLNSLEEPLGIGYFQKANTIAIRMMSSLVETIDTSWFLKRFTALKTYREFFLKEETTAYRLCYGESDQIPGLVIDIYNQMAIIQVNTKGIELLLSSILEALSLLDIKDHVVIAESQSAKKEQVLESIQTASKESIIWAKENSLEIAIPLHKAQKTGWFCDQRENRALVTKIVKEHTLHSVLNLFSYTGGFSLAALKGCARHVVSVDVDKNALLLLKEMVERNNLKGRHLEIASDVWEYLRSEKELFDLVIVDPPAFVKQASKKANGMKGYLDLFKMSIPKVKSQGFLMIYSCSYFITEEDLNWILRKAFVATKRTFQTISQLSQGFDHPVPAWFPEGKYLKGFLLKELPPL
ncbi:MAG: class I SAM-dependent rRNA methyltransferase [Chlamydiales bacterium]|nr:class I SAM-dependent rRNA methyltransferase [Chlamydiales bacterium]